MKREFMVILLVTLSLGQLWTPTEENVVYRETGWEFSEGEHDWFVQGVSVESSYKNHVYYNQTVRIYVFVELNGTFNYQTDLRASIHFTRHYDYFQMGIIPHGHSMTRNTDLATVVIFEYEYHWGWYDIGYNSYWYDEWGFSHEFSHHFYFINVSSSEAWETSGGYNHHELRIFWDTEEIVNTPPVGYDGGFKCGTGAYVNKCANPSSFLTWDCFYGSQLFYVLLVISGFYIGLKIIQYFNRRKNKP
jgi:hypothetical protein